MQPLKQSTAASTLVGPILDSTGASYTGAVIGDLNITKNGTTAAMAATATLTHDHNGYYILAMTTGNTDTLGRLDISCNKSTYAMTVARFEVLNAAMFDALVTNGNITTGTALTAAQIATGVWQDATAGDFTVASSIGKALYINNVAPGGSGGLLISGSNAGTTTFGALTVTGATTLTGAVTATNGSNSISGVGAVASVTGNVGGNVAGSVGSIASGGITTASFAAGAINAAAIADAAIDRATFAADTGLQTTRSNTAQAGAAGSITLDASASATTDFYKGLIVYLTGNTGAGQARVITAYNGTTKVASVTPNWAVNPDNTTTFAIVDSAGADVQMIRGTTSAGTAGYVGIDWSAVNAPTTAVNLSGTTISTTQVVASVSGAVGSVTGNVGGNVVGSVGSVTGNVGGNVVGSVASVTGNVGGNVVGSVGSVATGGITRASYAADTGHQSIRSNTAQSGGGTSITLDASASAVTDFYKNALVYVTGGTGAGQGRFITAYNGSTKVATVGSAWGTNPDNTSTFAIQPFDSIPGATAPTAAQNATAVWTDLLSGSDFSTASSIGKLLKDNIDAAVSSRMATYTQPTGFLAATFPSGTIANTTNITDAVVRLANGAHGGVAATITFERMIGVSTTTDAPAVKFTGNGLGAGMELVGDKGLYANATTTGVYATGTSFGYFGQGQSDGMRLQSINFGAGLRLSGGTFSPGLMVVAGAGGNAVDLFTSGFATGTLSGNIAGNLTGTVSTLTTYTGNTPQTGDSFARLGAPAGASVSADIAAVKTDTGNLVTRITATLFSGITSMAQWLGLISGKQTGDSTARTEVRATGAGSGTYDETTDSQEAIRDRGDAAWTTGSAAPTAVQNADALLGRNIAGGSDGGRTVASAFAAQRNKVAFDVPAVGQFTVYGTDDTTPLWTGTYVSSSSASPVTSIDPAT